MIGCQEEICGHLNEVLEKSAVYTEDFTEKIAFPSGFLKVLKPTNGISAKYLAALLSTKIVVDQIKAQTVGLTIPSRDCRGKRTAYCRGAII